MSGHGPWAVARPPADDAGRTDDRAATALQCTREPQAASSVRARAPRVVLPASRVPLPLAEGSVTWDGHAHAHAPSAPIAPSRFCFHASARCFCFCSPPRPGPSDPLPSPPALAPASSPGHGASTCLLPACALPLSHALRRYRAILTAHVRTPGCKAVAAHPRIPRRCRCRRPREPGPLIMVKGGLDRDARRKT